MNTHLPLKTASYKKAVMLSMVFNFASKGILFLLTIFIAHYFGSTVRTDIYFFVYGTMVLLSGFFSAIDTAVLIPRSMRIRASEGNESAMRFLNYFLRIYFLIGIGFVVLFLFLGTAIFSLFSKFSTEDMQSYRHYFLAGSLYFFFLLLTNYFNAILTSLKYFTVPLFISALNSCMVILLIVILHEQYDVMSIFIGGIAAYSINLLVLAVLMKSRAGWRFGGKTGGVGAGTWGHVAYAELGQLATFAGSFFPLYLLSGFGNGIISVMNYGKNIADIPSTLITAQVANVSGIKLNEQFVAGDHRGMNDTFMNTSRVLVFILVPVGFFLFLFAEPVVRLFYFRGHFNEQALQDSARFLQLLSITVFSTGVNAIVSRVFMAAQAIRQAFVYQLVLNVFGIAAIWIFTRYYQGVGYAYGVITLNLVNFLMLYFICKRLAVRINYASILRYTVWVVLVNGAIAAALYGIAPLMQAGLLTNLIILFILQAGGLLGCCWLGRRTGIFDLLKFGFNVLPGAEE